MGWEALRGEEATGNTFQGGLSPGRCNLTDRRPRGTPRAQTCLCATLSCGSDAALVPYSNGL